jgi:(1->4)-alpha-D-glucan 1-alpha-D-glucosylmutase
VARGDEAGTQVVAVVTRLGERLDVAGGWAAETLDLPEGDWVDLLGDRPVSRGPAGAVRLVDLLGALPVALLVRHGSLDRT